MELRSRELGVRYGQVTALEGVNLSLPFPTHARVRGPAGSGKTTLLKALAGLISPTAGEVLWDGRTVSALSRRELKALQSRVGMIFQSDALFDSSTVLENVMLPLTRRGVEVRQARARAEEALAEVGLTDAAGLRPDRLSGGMKKRVGIARALIARPSILIADTPLAGLDPGTAHEVGRLIERMSSGKTLIVASEDPLPGITFEREVRLRAGRQEG